MRLIWWLPVWTLTSLGAICTWVDGKLAVASIKMFHFIWWRQGIILAAKVSLKSLFYESWAQPLTLVRSLPTTSQRNFAASKSRSLFFQPRVAPRSSNWKRKLRGLLFVGSMNNFENKILKIERYSFLKYLFSDFYNPKSYFIVGILQ